MPTVPWSSILVATAWTTEDHGAFAHGLALALAGRSRLTVAHVGPHQPEHDGAPSVRAQLARWGVLPAGAPRSAVAGLGLDVIKAQVAQFWPRAEERKLRLNLSPSPSHCLVLADRLRLEQVLANLLDNAIKYCPAGSEVMVSWTVDALARMVTVAVADTGAGIEAAHLPRLFERFYRVDTGRSRALGGTGLGLSIVKHAVEAMNGHVFVESTVGQGTTFRFTLRLADAE